MNKLHEKINLLKKQKGYTIAQLSKVSEIPLGTLNKICNGSIKNVNVNHLNKLASALEVDVALLMDNTTLDEGYSNNTNPDFGFVRVCPTSTPLRVGDCLHNANQIEQKVIGLDKNKVAVALFPQLSICGCTAGDLLTTTTLLKNCQEAVSLLLKSTANTNVLFVVGAPIYFDGKVYNCAVVCLAGKILGIVPKTNLTYTEMRWFSNCFTPAQITYCNQTVPFGELTFTNVNGFTFACQFDTPTATNADAVLVLSATPHLVGATERVTCALKTASRNGTTVVYSNAHFTESTSKQVFSAHAMVVERGKIIAESKPFANKNCITEIDVNLKVSASKSASTVTYSQNTVLQQLTRKFNKYPFVPQNATALAQRTEEILTMQAFALKKRLEHTGSKTAVIGVSGGLDSTLALFVIKRAFDLMGKNPADIVAVTMPCFGTTNTTLNNSIQLANIVGATLKKVDISQAVNQHLKDIGHDYSPDLTFENAQARERTQVLMDIANQTQGIVVGTGDLSEIALGWSTFNGDHMSMYNPNCDVPKTLIPHLIQHESKKLTALQQQTLLSIVNTPVSPELLPTVDGATTQRTEDIVGRYVLHDFFLHCFAKGYDANKTLFVALQTFDEYTEEEVKSTLKKFVSRFVTQQFKRNCSADGVQIGSVSLDGNNWQMPSDVAVLPFLTL